jgi:hypothetical protein
MTKVIKGALIGAQVRGFMGYSFFRFLVFTTISVVILVIFLFRELPEYFNHGKTVPFQFFVVALMIIGVAVFSYSRAREEYYYFEIDDRAITVRSLMKSYERTFQISQITKVGFHYPVKFGSSVMITFGEHGSITTKSYSANGYSTHDFIELRNCLEAAHITWEDPTGWFFLPK